MNDKCLVLLFRTFGLPPVERWRSATLNQNCVIYHDNLVYDMTGYFCPIAVAVGS